MVTLEPREAAKLVLYRGMEDDDGRPRCHKHSLGVRLGTDITPTEKGQVDPLTGGMSVAPDNPDHLPPHRKPRALGGTSDWPAWVLDVTSLAERPLSYRADPSKPRKHGFVEPSEPMPTTSYVAALEATAESWTRVDGT